jgi:1-acyl-sn-glycerol-3-phosphate acyltransferase
VEGLDVLSRIEGPVIFVANHASHLDTPLILLSLPDEWRRRTAVAAAADYFFDTWWRAVGSVLLFNTFPIDRRGGSMSATPGEVLADGWSLVIFPEGTRRTAGWAASGWAPPSSPVSTACPSFPSRIAARSPRCRAGRAGRAGVDDS